MVEAAEAFGGPSRQFFCKISGKAPHTAIKKTKTREVCSMLCFLVFVYVLVE